MHIEKGDSSQVGDHFENVQLGESNILIEDKLEDDFEVVPLSRESKNDIIGLGEKIKSDAINDVYAQKGKKIGIKKIVLDEICPTRIFN